jgi:chemotaxis protein MotB
VKRIRHKAGEHENTERWLLTYADLITLLLGLFVILYAMSNIDATKYTALVNAFGDVFGETPVGRGPGIAGGIQPPINVMQSDRNRIDNEIREALQNHAESGGITISNNARGVTIHIAEGLLFESGSADLKPSSAAALDTIAGVLARFPNDVRVEGHTDNVPISTAAFPSNWHLSVARALNTAYYLVQKHGLNQERVGVVGYSEFHPLVANTSVENRARNRRVDIVVVTKVAEERDTEHFNHMEVMQ